MPYEYYTRKELLEKHNKNEREVQKYLGELVWCQDDVYYPGRETTGDAWKRLFNEPLPSREGIKCFDCGDTLYYIMPNKHILCYCCGISSIYEVKEP